MNASAAANWTDTIELFLLLMVPVAVLLTVRYLNRHDGMVELRTSTAPSVPDLR